jgi:hypothetical protein
MDPDLWFIVSFVKVDTVLSESFPVVSGLHVFKFGVPQLALHRPYVELHVVVIWIDFSERLICDFIYAEKWSQ